MEDSLTRDGTEGREQPAAGAEPVRRQGETPRQQIRKAKQITRRRFSAEDNIRIVMEGIRGEDSVSEICRRERLHTTIYYKWLKEFMEAGKRRLRGDIQREAGREEVASPKEENARLITGRQRKKGKRPVWNQLRPEERRLVLEQALAATRFFIPGWGHYWLVSMLDDG